jgi:hypothetical protein
VAGAAVAVRRFKGMPKMKLNAAVKQKIQHMIPKEGRRKQLWLLPGRVSLSWLAHHQVPP